MHRAPCMQALALESEIGPFSFFIRGLVSGWRADGGANGSTGELDFQFNQVDICFLGNKVR